MKKNIFISAIALSTFAMLFNACKDEKMLFDASAAERLAAAKNELHQLLMSSPDGWEFVYFTDSANYGGYNMLLSFSETEVTAQGDQIFPTGRHKSEYQIAAPQSVALRFATYNNVISLLGNPDKTTLTGKGQTLGGENELLWIRTSENKDTITFRSKKSNTVSKMVRHHGSDWDLYFAKVRNNNSYFTNNMDKYFKQVVFEDGDVVYMTGYNSLYRTMSPLFKINEELIRGKNGIAFTQEGFHFAKPVVTPEGKRFSKFGYDDAQQKFLISEGNVGGFMQGVAQPDFVFRGPPIRDNSGTILGYNSLGTYLFPAGGHPAGVGEYLYFTAFEGEMSEIVDSLSVTAYRYLEADFDSYYRFVCMIATSNTSTTPKFRLIYYKKSDTNRSYDAVSMTFNYSRASDRADKVTLKRDATLNITGDAASDPTVKEWAQKFIEKMASTEGYSYIIVPNTDFSEFTLGSTVANIACSVRIAY